MYTYVLRYIYIYIYLITYVYVSFLFHFAGSVVIFQISHQLMGRPQHHGWRLFKPCHVQAVQRGEITTVLRTDVDVVDYYTNRKLEKMIKKIKRQFNIYIFWNRFWKKPCHVSLVHTNITLLPNPWIVTYESLGVFVKITLVKKRYEFSGNNFILGSWYQLHLSL